MKNVLMLASCMASHPAHARAAPISTPREQLFPPLSRLLNHFHPHERHKNASVEIAPPKGSSLNPKTIIVA